jgi:hypothetical protein
MALNKSFLMALDNDFNTAVRAVEKDKAVAIVSTLVGIAISVVPAQTGQLYAMLNKVTTVSFAQLNTDKNAVLHLITKNI